MQPGTGEVKALAQNKKYGKGPGKSYLNYTVPKKFGNANGFQPGSTFKAFVLATAINQDIPLSRTYSSASPAYMPEQGYKTCDGSPYGYGTWPVKNSTSASAAPNLYEGTQKSVNTFFARLEADTGLCAPWKLVNRLGIEVPKQFMVPSFTLGVADVSPLDMAEAYATFAADGKHCASRPVTKIADSSGNVLKTYKANCRQELPVNVARAVSDILKGVINSGGFASAQYPGQPAAGKTGTTQNNQAVWFVGYTPNLVGASMIAGVNQVGQPASLSYIPIAGSYVDPSGSGTAAPIWVTRSRRSRRCCRIPPSPHRTPTPSTVSR